MVSKTKILRRLFANKKIIRVMGGHNALSAQLAERAGFQGIWASGLEICSTYGVPDANILTMADFLHVATIINNAVALPVIADCDTGFGNSSNVIYMVRKYEAAGIAAVCIEDKHFPKVNSFIAYRQELAPISEFVGKILAAKNAQKSKDFMVIARIEALIAGWGIDEALRRAKAYVDAGADAILIHSKQKTFSEIEEFSRRWNGDTPIVVVPTTFSNTTIEELEKCRIRMVIYANHGIRASIKAMKKTFADIYAAGNSACVEDSIVSLEEVFQLQGMNEIKDNELVFSRQAQESITTVIPAAGDHLEEYSMKDISQDVPIAMLDINGKPLLQRQVETLNRCKIYDIRLIGGYKADLINVSGINLIVNHDYAKTGILYSIMCGLKDLQGPALVIYGDLLFDHFLIKKLLESTADIVLVVDESSNDGSRVKKKNSELVITEPRIEHKTRSIHNNKLYPVLAIGSRVSVLEANLEFCGIMYLSACGLKQLQENYNKYIRNGLGQDKAGIKELAKISLVDFLQLLVDNGIRIQCINVNSGWIEVNTMEDYKLACATFKQ